MKNKIKAAVIGVGFIGTAHVEALRRLNFVEVEAIADDTPQIEEKAKQLEVTKFFRSYRELLLDPEIDAVHICTPNVFHYTMAKDALMAGKNVICEKPLTTTRIEAEELLNLAQAKGLIHATNFNVRFYPLMHELKYAIEAGEMGDVFSVNGSYLQDWLFFATDYNWRLEPELSGNSRAVADIGSHWMDLCEFVTGLKITEVMADFATFHPIRKKPLKPVETYTGKLLTQDDYEDVTVNTEDYASMLFRFSNGARGSLTVSQVFAGKKNCITLEMAGSEKSASWMSERPNEIWYGSRTNPNQLLLKDPLLMMSESRQIVSFPGGHNEGFPDTFKQLFLKIYNHISGKSNNADYPTFEAGLREIHLCEKIVESNVNKCWVKV